MKLDVPRVITEMPSKDYVKEFYKVEGYQLKLWFKIAKKVHHRTRLAEAQNWKCCYCGCRMNTLSNNKRAVTVEHVTPLSLGGPDTWENTVAACSACNSKRGNVPLTEEYTLTKEINFPKERSYTQEGLSAQERRNLKKLEGYKKRAEQLSAHEFMIGEFVKSAQQWLASIKLQQKYRDELKNFMQENGWL